jgi:HTH-type transcriptional regulator / antitoxin HigA
MKEQQSYSPDYVPPPGKTLEEFIVARDLSARELARRCGRSAKLFVEIISGKAPIEPQTAMQLERVLGMDASVWLNMEAAYRLHLARTEEAESLEEVRDLVQKFPLAELTARGLIRSTRDDATHASELLRFFGAGSFNALQERQRELQSVSFRHSPSFKSKTEPLLAWLRIGEIQSEGIQTAPFERSRFLEALKKIRNLTTKDPQEFEEQMRNECRRAGVVFLLVPPFSGLRLSGIARWLVPNKALIQQTLRHKSNDHFWFTFFHEAAHLLLHSRKSLFIDGENLRDDAKEEEEANHWAANFLVPQQELHRFIAKGEFGKADVSSFADNLGIAAGIIVGQLQNKKIIPWNSPLNGLKIPFEWVSAATAQ